MTDSTVQARGNGILLSACIIARDEEKHLPRCLESLRGFADEIIFIDTGSVDRTVEIAQSFGATVFQEEWQDDFSLHRNQAFDRANGKWLLTIDCDEEVVETDTAETRRRLENGNLPSLLMVREMLLYPEGRNFTMLTPRMVLRESGIRYVYPIHEQLNVNDGQAVLSNVQILHHGYTSRTGLVEKEKRNLEIAKRMGDDPHALHCRARASLSLGDWQGVFDAAEPLVNEGVPLALFVEGCVMGGAAAYNLNDDEAFDRFVVEGSEAAPDTPDIAFLELLGAGRKYARLLHDGDSTTPGEYIRPWVFWHNRGQVQLCMDVLLGKRTLAVTGEQTAEGGEVRVGANMAQLSSQSQEVAK